MAVIEVTIKIPGSCSECQWYHCDRHYSYEDGEEWESRCDLGDDDGYLDTILDEGPVWEDSPTICPLRVLAAAMGIEMPKPEGTPPEGIKPIEIKWDSLKLDELI